MQFRDLSTQYLQHKEKIDDAILKVISSSNFIMGEEVLELENRLARYVGVKNCVSCANGTDALQLALMTWNVGSGDAVFVPDFTFFSTAEVVAIVGATPIFVDIDLDTFCISPESLIKAIDYVNSETTLTPKVIIAVDLFGQPSDYTSLKSIAKDNKLLLLEDGAQGFGGKIGNQKACSFGAISTTSFFPAKPLGCYGDGGAIFTDDDDWAQLLKSFRVHGKGEDKYDNVRIGLNSRLDTIQAAILIEKLHFFDEEISKCQEIVKWYSEGLADNSEVTLPLIKEGVYSSWAQYTIRFKNRQVRDCVQNRLKEKNIPAMIYYSKPLHMQKAFAQMGIQVDCANSILASETSLSLPMSAYLDKEQIDEVAKTINNCVFCEYR